MEAKLIALLSNGPDSFARIAFELADGPKGRRNLLALVKRMAADGHISTWEERGALMVRSA